jgi:hypothetical protein
MRFEDFIKHLQENSLYTDANSKSALSSDKERLMDSLMFNFFGFLGLYRLSDSRSFLKTYDSTEGKLMVNEIGDKNHDVSLSVKMAHDAGLINTAVVNKMTRLLALIKQKRLRGKDLDENQIRALLDEIHYASHKPSVRVFLAVQAFHNGVLDLPNLAKELYKLAKLREYKGITGEFRELVMKGQYNDFFSKLKPPAQTTGIPITLPPSNNTSNSSVDKIPADNALPQKTAANSVKTTPKSKALDDVAAKKAVVKLGQTNEFMEAIFNATNQKQFDDAFETYGVDEKNFDFSKFKNWLISSKKSKRPNVSIMSWPLFNWLDSSLATKNIEARKSINLVTLNYFRSFAELGEINEFIKDIEKIDFSKIKKFFDSSLSRDYDDIVSKLMELFVKNVISRVTDFSDSTFNKIESIYDSIKKFAETVGAFQATVIQNVNLYKEFNGTSAILLALDALPDSAINIAFSGKLSKWFEKAFGSDCLIDSKSSLFLIKKPNYDKASSEMQKAFQLLVRKKINGAGVVDTQNEIGKIWLNHWSIKLVATPASNIVRSINNFKEIDVTKLTEKDIDYAYNELAVNSNVDSIAKVFELTDTSKLNTTGNAYYSNAMKVIEKLVKNDKIADSLILIIYASKRKSEFDAFTKLLENSSILSTVQKSFTEFLDSTPRCYPSLELLKELSKWYVSLVKRGKVKLSKSLAYFFYSKYKDIDYVLPSDQASIEELFNEKKSYFYMQEYLRWIVSKNEILRNKIIEFNEKTLDLSYYNGTLIDGFKITYPVKFLSDEYITDGIIRNFKRLWLEIGSLETIKRYEFSKKLTDAYNETIAKGLEDPNHVAFLFKALSTSSPEKFNEYFGKMDVQKIQEILDDSRTKERDVAKFLEMISNNKDFAKKLSTSSISNFFQAIGQEFSKNKNKYSKAIRDSMNESLCNYLLEMNGVGRESDVETIYAALIRDRNYKKDLIKYFSNHVFLKDASKVMFDDKNPIKPYMELDSKRVAEILRYNNVEIPKTSVNDAPTFKSLISRTNMANAVIQDLRVEETKASLTAMERKSVEYDVFNKYRHGNIAVKFLREFSVDLPVQRRGQEKFLEEQPKTEVIDPAFHGTGSVAASMILRYGFSVISSGDSSVVGRMLGNGIYFSTVLDKVSQYVSDAGYTRGIGTKGYIFQMHALLGRKMKDYSVAGVGGDNIISPEWCVFRPNEQLRIYKAFEAEIISKEEMDKLKEKYKINENTAVRILSFKEFLREAMTPGLQTTTYTFVDGTIPISEIDAVDFEEFKPEQFGPHVRLEPSQNGPMVIIDHEGDESQAYCVRYTFQFMTDDEELQKFLNLLRKNSA